MDLRRAVRGIVRAHAGFAIVRVNSIGKVYPEKTSVDVPRVLRRRLGKE